MKGYTEVWTGDPKRLLVAAHGWSSFHGTDAVRVTEPYAGGLSLWVANEFIDWQHYRRTDEYISCWGQTKINPKRGES